MGKQIISREQKAFLKYVASVPQLSSAFYFTGGTALTLYYLHHRQSEDLDFFSIKEFTPQDVTPYIQQAKQHLKYETFDYQQAFNRNIFQLRFSSHAFLKVEFTYFPFPQIEQPKQHDGISVDSLMDIAVNKVFTISQNPRGRDYFDLYTIQDLRS